MTWNHQQRWGCAKYSVQHLLIGFAEAKVLCTGENQSPVSRRNGKINVEAMRRRYDVREGSHRRLCGRCEDDNLDLVITQRESFLEAESVLHGWRGFDDDAFDTLALYGLNVACARTMRTGVVVASKSVTVQKCMPSTQFGVELHAMCAQVVREVAEVDVGAVAEVHHDTVSIAQQTA